MQNNIETPNWCLTQPTDYFISIVVPTFNEDKVLQAFHERTSNVITSISVDAEIIYVNDGSTDQTLTVMKTLKDTDSRVAILDLSRNYGKEIALSAGLDYAKGDAVIVIDADLQDPPELIPTLIKHWIEGYDVVYAKRISRDGESTLRVARRLPPGFFPFARRPFAHGAAADDRAARRRGVKELPQNLCL